MNEIRRKLDRKSTKNRWKIDKKSTKFRSWPLWPLGDGSGTHWDALKTASYRQVGLSWPPSWPSWPPCWLFGAPNRQSQALSWLSWDASRPCRAHCQREPFPEQRSKRVLARWWDVRNKPKARNSCAHAVFRKGREVERKRAHPKRQTSKKLSFGP